MIQNIMKEANEHLKDIAVNKTSGHVNDKLKEILKNKMKKNVDILTKMQTHGKNPFLSNNYVYNRIITSSLNYFEKSVLHTDPVVEKVDWIEFEYYNWLTSLLKTLQKFNSSSLVQMKVEIANVFNWYN
jgi:carbonic anhydrase